MGAPISLGFLIQWVHGKQREGIEGTNYVLIPLVKLAAPLSPIDLHTALPADHLHTRFDSAGLRFGVKTM